jgi:hypothetical protein
MQSLTKKKPIKSQESANYTTLRSKLIASLNMGIVFGTPMVKW